MKSTGAKYGLKSRNLQKNEKGSSISLTHEEVERYKKESEILLASSDDITKVREKNDLIIIFKQRIKGLFHITHSIVTLINEQEQTYIPFLLDNTGSPIRTHERYKEMVASHFSLNEPFIQAVLESNEPISFVLEEIMDLPDRPSFLRVNYEKGVRQILMTKLMKEGKPMGFIHTYTDNKEGFSREFRNLMKGIAPLLSGAVSNIIKNEEITEREREKSLLLELSSEIAKLRTKDDLQEIVNTKIKDLFSIEDFGLLQINPDETYTPFMVDLSRKVTDQEGYEEISKTRHSIYDPLFSKLKVSDGAILLDVSQLAENSEMPVYVSFWKKIGLKKVIGSPLKVGGKVIGCTFLHVDPERTKEIKPNLLDAVCAQISVAMSNIRANEEIEKREEEKTFLLNFSSSIATVRTKEELAKAVSRAVNKLSHNKGYEIRLINQDDATMSSYIHDLEEFGLHRTLIKDWSNLKYPINDGIQSRVLKSETPLIIHTDKEIQQGAKAEYLFHWKKMGLKKLATMRLRNGTTNLGALFLYIDEINVPLLKGICAQISTAMANIMANEQVALKQAEQSFLLEFSHDITRVKTKQDLQDAISTVLSKTMNIQFVMIRVIEEDGIHLSPFMFNRALFEKGSTGIDFDKMANDRITVEEYYTAQVLASENGMVFNIEEEFNNGSQYARLWKTAGLRNMYGLSLRMGNKNIGTIWVLANRMSNLLLNGICAQISIAIDNIQANEKILAYRKKLEVENDYLKEQIQTLYFTDIIGSADEMQKVYRLMSLVAESNATVLLTGETGTGKELIARAIHNTSPRRDKLMVKVNCAALPTNLIESELFGHERGAFTGAIDRRIGKFELANNSTIFIDEIGELPMEVQAKLLRVIQEREFERLGGKQIIKVDVRLIAATNRTLEDEVRKGRFRADLYFRLNVFPIHLPPLRNRMEDIEPLAKFFISKYSRITGRKIKKVSPVVMQKLRSYTWPGNVRELEHLIERTILLNTDGELKEVFIPENSNSEGNNEAQKLNRSLEEVERSYIIDTLKRCAGKVSGAGSASEILKVPGNTLHSKMKKLRINKSDYFSS